MSELTEPRNEELLPKSAAANPPSGIQLAKPLDEMSRASVAIIANVASIIAQRKLEAATKAAEAAREALARVAALRAGRTFQPNPPDVIDQPKAAANPAAPAPSTLVIEATGVDAGSPVGERASAAKTEAIPEAIAPEIIPTETVSAQTDADERSRNPLENADPEEIARLAEALRAALSAQRPKRKKPKGKRPLDPVAGIAGLYHPPRRRRKILTPGLVFLLVLMAVYALYASGNLPEFDRWSDSVVNSAHTHNDQVVGGILRSWKIFLTFGGVLLAAILGVLVNNTIHQRKSPAQDANLPTS